VQKEHQCKSTLSGFERESILGEDQYDRQWCSNPGSPGTGFSVQSLMEPLFQAPAIIPQIIMS
jgi:hypothetical protein